MVREMRFEEVPVEKLRWRCDPEELKFQSDLPITEEIIGQERAPRSAPGQSTWMRGARLYSEATTAFPRPQCITQKSSRHEIDTVLAWETWLMRLSRSPDRKVVRAERMNGKVRPPPLRLRSNDGASIAIEATR